jgi:hypothetical protein
MLLACSSRGGAADLWPEGVRGEARHRDAARETLEMRLQLSANEAWDTLAGALAPCLSDLQEDEFLIISYKDAHYFVQFAGQGAFGMRAEATSNSFIEPDAVLTDDQYAMMAVIGRRRMRAERRPEWVRV